MAYKKVNGRYVVDKDYTHNDENDPVTWKGPKDQYGNPKGSGPAMKGKGRRGKRGKKYM